MVAVWIPLSMLVGCSEWIGTEELPSRRPALQGDDVIWSAPATSAPAPLPSWARGELPETPSAVSEPERLALEGRICDGADAELNERVRAHLDHEAATTRYPGPWTSALVERCGQPGPALCAWIGEQVAARGDGPVSPGLFELWHVAGGCLDPAVWTWMPDREAPLYGIVDYLAQQDSQWRPVVDPRIPEMVAPLLREGSGVHYDYTLQVLGSVDDRTAARFLLDHRASISDVIEADRVGVWLYRQTDPEARRAFELACVSQPGAWQCREALNPLDDLEATVLGENVDASAVLDRYASHRSAILESLTRCVKMGPTEARSRAGRCIRALAGAGEDARIVEALVEVEDRVIDPLWNARIRTWKRFGTAQAVGEHLKGLDLIPAEFEPLDPREPPAYVVDWFVDADRAVVMAGLTNGIALRKLLAGVPGLEDAVVIARKTPATARSGSEPFDELLVWVDGRRQRVVADPYGVDVRQIAGFANTLAEQRDLDLRFVAVDPGDVILWGPRAGLRSLVQDELLDVVDKAPPVVETWDEEELFEEAGYVE